MTSFPHFFRFYRDTLFMHLVLRSKRNVLVQRSLDGQALEVTCVDGPIRYHLENTTSPDGVVATLTIKDVRSNVVKLVRRFLLLVLSMVLLDSWFGLTPARHWATNLALTCLCCVVGQFVANHICSYLWPERHGSQSHRIEEWGVDRYVTYINLGRSGALHITPQLLAHEATIESTGGGMRFSRCIGESDGTNRQHLTFRLSGPGTIDGQGATIQRLTVVASSGTGHIHNLNAEESLHIVVHSPVDVDTEYTSISDDEPLPRFTARPSFYKITLTHAAQCRVTMGACITRRNIKLNGVLDPPLCRSDCFIHPVCSNNNNK